MMKAYLILIFMITGFPASHAQQTPGARQQHFNVSKKGHPLDGYDPVSYFLGGDPKKGLEQWAHTHNGITYLFSTATNMKAFVADPEKYEPAYGGWCAYAIGTSGEKVEVDPMTYKIYDGKLLLFYNKSSVNTLSLWNKNEVTFYDTAESQWSIITNH